MKIKIYPPTNISGSPFTKQWYDLDIIKVSFNLSQNIHEYNIADSNRALMAGYEHSTSIMTLNGVISLNSAIPGSTIESKKENFMEAASAWWTFGDQINRVECAQIDWRGWVQYIMIQRLEIESIAGEETDEYSYTLTLFIHEGQ